MADAAPKPAMKIIRWLCVIVVVVVATGTFAGARGCERARVTRELKEGEKVPVVVAGRTFMLEPVLDEKSRTRGLGGRASIEPDGGMLFVFPYAGRLEFVMRDCLTDIDIAFLDDAGRVLTMYTMNVEPPMAPGESATAYEFRLKKYPSRFPTALVAEFAGGTLEKLGVKPGDRFEIDLPPLKARAK